MTALDLRSPPVWAASSSAEWPGFGYGPKAAPRCARPVQRGVSSRRAHASHPSHKVGAQSAVSTPFAPEDQKSYCE